MGVLHLRHWQNIQAAGMSKVCNVCGETKSLTEFGMRNERRSDGTPYIYYRPRCKICRNKRAKELRATPESRAKRSKRGKEYRRRTAEKERARRSTPEYKERQRAYRKKRGIKPRQTVQERQQKEAQEGHAKCSKCKERLPLGNFRYYNTKRFDFKIRSCGCLTCEKTRFKAIRKTDKYKKRMKEYARVYHQTEKHKNYRTKYRSDPLVRFRNSISAQVRQHIKAVAMERKKNGKLFDHLPYTPEQLVNHIESLWEGGMSWQNYGEWHIDHVCPQAALPYDSLEHPNFQKCWALENLQPLWASDNACKSSYYNGKKHFYIKDKQ